eukprot:8455011-Alexandrium_andersonii.AAC.1
MSMLFPLGACMCCGSSNISSSYPFYVAIPLDTASISSTAARRRKAAAQAVVVVAAVTATAIVPCALRGAAGWLVETCVSVPFGGSTLQELPRRHESSR